MVWSEQVGTSLIIPSDRMPGDGRNYLVLGEDVPPQIADQFTAALVFRSGIHDGTESTDLVTGIQAGFVFYAFGISKAGNLEVVTYFFTTGSVNADAYTYYRQTVLSIAAPKSINSAPGAANGPVIALGTDTSYDTYNEGPAALTRIGSEVLTDIAFLGSASGSSSGSVTTSGTVVSILVTVPLVASTRRVTVTGRVFVVTPTGVGVTLSLNNAVSGRGSFSRLINQSITGGSDLSIELNDADISPGQRTYNLVIAATVAGQVLTYRAPTISARIE